MAVDYHDEDDFPFVDFPVEPDAYIPPGYLPDGTPVFAGPPCWFYFRGELVLGIPVWAAYQDEEEDSQK